MLTGIDHVIIGVKDLERASVLFSERLGLTVSGGGRHPLGGTANRIIVIGDTYLELITVVAADEAQPSMLERLAKGEGYWNFALASDAIAEDCQRMRARGVPVLGPVHGELRAADGRVRSWLRADIERPDLAQHYPFLIQHDSSGEERRFRLAGWQQPPTHPLGAVRVSSVTIAVADLQEGQQRFSHIYGLEASPPYTGQADHWEALLTAFPLANGFQSFELAAPLPLASAGDSLLSLGEFLPEPGSLTRYLQTVGENLCRMTLEVADLKAARRYLEQQGVIYTFQAEPQPALWIHPGWTCGAAIVLHQLT
ncbi:VOC family protein [Thermogemmatispora sp.]|uniref:VOC family protein n=1 Tax=Thermogemmatispora sp. TaxID=1968838 RepID=UPI001D8ECC04|nr:VOC family protein [Thermogemmatispora sp.]MBX5449625.1 VOC family protein [Thermogemmatispora sp.]